MLSHFQTFSDSKGWFSLQIKQRLGTISIVHMMGNRYQSLV